MENLNKVYKWLDQCQKEGCFETVIGAEKDVHNHVTYHYLCEKHFTELTPPQDHTYGK